MKRKLLVAALYGLFGLATYVFFLYLTFPSDTARDRFVYEANKAGIRLQLAGLSPSFPFGVRLSGLDLYKPQKKNRRHTADKMLRPSLAPGALLDPAVDSGTADADAPSSGAGEGTDRDGGQTDAPPETPVLSVDRLTIASLLPLVIPAKGTAGPVDFEAELYDGTATGTYEEGEDTMSIALAARSLDLGRYPLTSDDFSIQLTGDLDVDAELSINKTRIRESNGTVHISLDNLSILKGSKIKGFDIPMTLAFAFSGGDATVEKGRVEFKDLALESPPLTVKVNGSIMLNKTLARCRFNLKVAMKFGDDLAVVAAFLSSSAKSDDGYYHYIISGPFERLRTRPDRLAARRAGAGHRKAIGVGRDTEKDDFRPGIPRPRGTSPTLKRTHRRGGPAALDSEERRRLREERRKRAEERRKRRQALREARMRELERRRNQGLGTDEGIDELRPADIIPGVPDVDVRYRNYDEPQDVGDPQDAPPPDQLLEPGDALEPDLPQDVPGEWDEPPQ